MKGNRNVNLIAINWEKSSNTLNYPGARGHVEMHGNSTAEFIDFMVFKKKGFVRKKKSITFEFNTPQLKRIRRSHSVVTTKLY